MDRAVVHTKKEVQELGELNIGWARNLPFVLIPRGLIEQLRDAKFSYEEYLAIAEEMDKSPYYWNICLVAGDRILGAIWGHIELLDRIMYIDRASFYPGLFSVTNRLDKAAWKEIEQFSKDLGMSKVIFLSTRWKAFLRKLPFLEVFDTKVLGVENGTDWRFFIEK